MSRRSPYLVLLACMFASQAALIVMTPVLAQAAADLGVSVGAAGQLRSVAGLTAALTTLLVPRAARRTSLGRLMLGSCVLLALGSLAAAAAPTFAALAAAQVPVG